MRRYCFDCQSPASIHIASWTDAALSGLVPRSLSLNYSLENALNLGVFRILCALGIARLSNSFAPEDVSARVALFAEAAQERGIACFALCIAGRYTEHLVLEYQGRRYALEAYPTAAHRDGRFARYTDSKIDTKEHLRKGNFPAPRALPYYFWQEERSVKESLHILRMPLVVKPAAGTFSRHVTTNITNETRLRQAIAHAIAYQPSFLVEEYVHPGSVHRVMVVDFQVVAVARQECAQVIGDGTSTVQELIDAKNAIRSKDSARSPHPLLQPIPTDADLSQDEFARVPAKGERVRVQKDPFLRLGADIIDETERIHPSITALCEAVARHFDIRCAGIDIVLEDCAKPREGQTCQILEINNLPSIELHQARAKNVARSLVDLFITYYAS